MLINPEHEPTEGSMQDELHGLLSLRNNEPIVPNIYVYAWESDLLSVTRAGYVHEFEIKISRADFKHDAKKREKHDVLRTGKAYSWTYYESVARKRTVIEEAETHITKRRPNYFWYACPQGMVSAKEVPEYAGLIEIEIGQSYYHHNRTKPAPLLHREKITPRQIQSIDRSFSFKYWRMRRMYNDAVSS